MGFIYIFFLIKMHFTFFFFLIKSKELKLNPGPFLLKDCCFLRLVQFSEFWEVLGRLFQVLVG